MIQNCSRGSLLFCKINTMLFEVHMKFHFCSVFFTFHYEVISEELKPQKVTAPQKKKKHLKQNFK